MVNAVLSRLGMSPSAPTAMLHLNDQLSPKLKYLVLIEGTKAKIK